MSNMLPSDSVLVDTLRDVVRHTLRNGDTASLTVKRMRLAAEEKLRLEPGFFKNDAAGWKIKSKQVIEEEAVGLRLFDNQSLQLPDAETQVKAAQHDFGQNTESDGLTNDFSSPEAIESSPVKPPAKPRKRASPTPVKVSTKRKVEEIDEAPKKKKAKSIAQARESKQKKLPPKSKVALESDEEELSETKTPSTPEKSPAALNRNGNLALDDESDLSELEDDSPPKKPKKNRKGPKGEGGKANVKPEKKAKAVKDKSIEEPDTERIKSLQGWLLRCGIRKVWGSYLKPYETPRAKIKHLESMLSDVGMTGRFSLEKAIQIKEKRELAADLEAVQEGDKKWGKVESEEEGGRPRRRLAKGFQGLDFLDDDDGEETD